MTPSTPKLHNPYKSAKKKKSEARRSYDGPLSRQGSLSSTGSSTNYYPSSSAESPQVMNAPSRQNSINNNDRKPTAEPAGRPGAKATISYEDEDIQELFKDILPVEFDNPLESTQREQGVSHVSKAGVHSNKDGKTSPIDLTKSQDDGETSGTGNNQNYLKRSVETNGKLTGSTTSAGNDCVGFQYNKNKALEDSKSPQKNNAISGKSTGMDNSPKDLPVAHEKKEQDTKESNIGLGAESAYAGTNLGDSRLPYGDNGHGTKDSIVEPAESRAAIAEFFLPGNQNTTDCKKTTKKRRSSMKKPHEEEQGTKQRKLFDCWTTKADDSRTHPQKTSLQLCSQPSSDEEDDDEDDRKLPALTQRFHQMTQEEHTGFVHQLTQRMRDSNDELVSKWETDQTGKPENPEDDTDDDPIDLDLEEEEVLSKIRGLSQLEEDVEFARNKEPLKADEVCRYEPPIGTEQPRTYRVGETWFTPHALDGDIVPDWVYTIVGFYLTGTTTKYAKCIVNRRMNRTFLGKDWRECWVEQDGEPVKVPLSRLTRILEGFAKPRYLWSENTGKTKGSDGYGFTYRHVIGEECAKKDISEAPVVVELYAGVGGMSLGFENAGFNVSYLVENESSTAGTLQAMFPDKLVMEEDVEIFLEGVTSRAPGYPQTATHVHASTPCQGFSRANREKNGGKNGPKNNSQVRKFVKAIEVLRPETASFENVTGILDDKHLCFLQEVVATLFLELEYNVRVSVLNASHYGDAQSRSRVFLFASKKGIELPSEPVKTHGEMRNLSNPKTVKECIGDLEGIRPRIGSGFVVLPGGEKVFNHSSEGTDLKNEEARILLKANSTAPTLYNQSTNAMAHYSEPRCLTVREMARLQSFPDACRLPSSRSKARKQIYNAVPVHLATAVANSIMGSCYNRNYPHGDTYDEG